MADTPILNYKGKYDGPEIDKAVELALSLENLESCPYHIYVSLSQPDYVLTVGLGDAEGNLFNHAEIDLPLESMVVNATYSNGSIVLHLQDGTSTEPIPISSLIAGLVSETRTIAGIDLRDDITPKELRDALDVYTKDSIDQLVTALENRFDEILNEHDTQIKKNTSDIAINKNDILSVANNVTTTNAKAGTSTTNTLSSVGWHRIFAAERQQFARSGILMINRAFGSREPESHTILFNITQGRAVLELLNKNVEKQSISKLRLVHANSSPQSKACFIDIYYNETGENKITSSVFCESIVATGAGSNFMNSRFVASNLSADIPEGYTSTELSLTNGDFLDRLTALETALSQTQTD